MLITAEIEKKNCTMFVCYTAFYTKGDSSPRYKATKVRTMHSACVCIYLCVRAFKVLLIISYRLILLFLVIVTYCCRY